MTLLGKANKLYKEGQFDKALKNYYEIEKSIPFLAKYISVNIDLTCKKLGIARKSSETNTIKVSVIIPSHNVSDYIKRCIDSILTQTLYDIEVIVVDDGSKDNTLAILKKYVEKDNRVKVISNAQASGNSGTPRNQALAIAKGEYIAFVDSDDYIEPNMFETLYIKAKEDDADIVSSGGFFRENSDGTTEIVNVTNRLFDKTTQPAREDLFKSIHFPIVWFRIYRNKFIQDNHIRFGEYKTSADLPFAVKALCLCNKLVSVDENFYHYRFDRPGSTIDRRKGLGAFEVFKAYNNVINFLYSCDLYDKYLPFVMQKAIGDYVYNNKFLIDEFKDDFTNVMSCLVSKHFEDIKDWSIFSTYWKGMLEKMLLVSKDQKEDHFDNFIKSSQKNIPNISVIIPAHNVGSYIDKCLSTLAKQTLENIEFIVINDGSSDDTIEFIDSYALKDARFKCIEISKPSGNPGTPRNVGLAYATGEYIGFVDADDWVDVDFFEKLYAASDNNNVDIVTANGFVRVEDDFKNQINIGLTDFDVSKNSNRKPLFKKPYFSNLWYRIYKNEFLRKNNITIPSIYLSEDFCFSFVSHSLAERISVVKNVNYYYKYDRPGSTTDKRKGAKAFEQIHSHDVVWNYINKFNLPNEFLNYFIYKKFNSYWYTYSRLDNSLKESFLLELNKLLSSYDKKAFDRKLFSDAEWKNLEHVLAVSFVA